MNRQHNILSATTDAEMVRTFVESYNEETKAFYLAMMHGTPRQRMPLWLPTNVEPLPPLAECYDDRTDTFTWPKRFNKETGETELWLDTPAPMAT